MLAGAAIIASPVGAAAVGAMAVTVALAMRPWTRRSRHIGEHEAQRGQEVAAQFADIIATVRPVILFDVGSPVAASFDAASREQIHLYRSSRFLASASPAVFQALVACAAAGGLWILSGRSISNIAAFGSIALLSLRAVSQGQLAQQAAQTLGAQQGFINQLLARALAGEPDILLLDEATSALDNASEERIRNALGALNGTVSISDRGLPPSTLSLCDRIVRIDDGKVADPEGE